MAIIVIAGFTFYDYMLNLKEVYAYAYSLILSVIAIGLYVNTNEGKGHFELTKGSLRELNAITWAKKNEVVTSTLIVMGIIIVSTIIIALFDMGIYKVISSNLH